MHAYDGCDALGQYHYLRGTFEEWRGAGTQAQAGPSMQWQPCMVTVACMTRQQYDGYSSAMQRLQSVPDAESFLLWHHW